MVRSQELNIVYNFKILLSFYTRMDHSNPLINAHKQMSRATQYISPQVSSVLPKLLAPERVMEASLSITRDDGSLIVLPAYRSQYSSVRGPYKGGIRFHAGVTRDEVIALSLWMSLKTAVLDLPLGGGKGGVIFNPQEFSQAEIEQVARAYSRAFAPVLGPTIDVPAPDVNTNGQIMSWMLDEYEITKGMKAPGTFTGKPLSLGGSLGRDAATARGGLFALEKYLAMTGGSLMGKTAIIQGSGNAGLTMARLLQEKGVKIVGISDSSSALYDINGLPVEEILAFKATNKKFKDSSFHSQMITNSELLTSSADILVPAALENQITAENASMIQANIIVELANGPTTPEADTILFNKGIVVIPDILANAGGVTVSYFEQVQNASNYYWSVQEVNMKLLERMNSATEGVVMAAKKHSIDLRTGAQVIALERILEATRLRG